MWIVVNIGCIECGVSTKIVGVFSDEVRANSIAAECEKTHFWRGGGQNEFEVFRLPETDIIDAEYAEGSNVVIKGQTKA